MDSKDELTAAGLAAPAEEGDLGEGAAQAETVTADAATEADKAEETETIAQAEIALPEIQFETVAADAAAEADKAEETEAIAQAETALPEIQAETVAAYAAAEADKAEETEAIAQAEMASPEAAAETLPQEPAADAAQGKKKSTMKEILSWVLTIGSAVLIALFIRTFLFEPIRVDGESMMDTLHDKEVMFVTKPEYIFGQPQRGDVVICRYPGRTENFVKRLIAVPGDTISIKNNVVYVNGEAVDEPYLTSSRNDDGYSMDEMTLAEDQYFVMGDNRDNSHDSRNYYGWGKPATLTRSQIIGHVRFVMFPFSDARGIE